MRSPVTTHRTRTGLRPEANRLAMRALLGQRSHAAQADLGFRRRGAAVHGYEDRGRRAGRCRHQQLASGLADLDRVSCPSSEATLAPDGRPSVRIARDS